MSRATSGCARRWTSSPSRADAEGRWKLQQTFNDRFVVPIEAKGEPSRWVRLRALEVLQAWSAGPAEHRPA